MMSIATSPTSVLQLLGDHVADATVADTETTRWYLTLACLRVFLETFVCIYDTVDNNSEINDDFTKTFGVVGNSFLINISSSNIFSIMLSIERFHQNCQAAIGINGLSIGSLPIS